MVENLDLWNVVISVGAAVISIVACFQAKKANKIAKQANLHSSEANVLAKNYQYANLLLDLYAKKYISQAVFFLTSPKLFDKYCRRMATAVRQSQKEFEEQKMAVIFDYIIDYEHKKIYELKDNQKKKVVIDEVYQLLEDLELLLPFIDKTNTDESNKIEDFITHAKSKTNKGCQWINKYASAFNHPEASFFEKKYKQVRTTEKTEINVVLPQAVIEFAWQITELNKENTRYLKVYDFSKGRLEEANNVIKNHYGNYYVYKDLREVYKQSLFYKNGGK